MTIFSAKVILEDLVFPECLRWHNDRLWFVDMYDGRLLSLDGGGEITEHYSVQAVLGGIIFPDQQAPVVTNKYARRLETIAGGVFADLSSFGSSPLNDAISLPDGQFILGEYGFDMAVGEAFAKGNLYLVDAKTVKGDATVKIAASGLAFPNGMAISPCGKTLYVAETIAARITRFDICDGGSLSRADTLIKFENGRPDGIAADRQGAIWASLLEESSLVKVGPDGTISATLKMEAQPFDVAVGDHDETLFVATSMAVADDLNKSERPRTGKIWEISL